MSVIERFSLRRVVELTGLSKSRIQQFDKSEILQPSLRGEPGPANQGLYTLEDVIALRAVGKLATDFKLRKSDIERACRWLAKRYPEKPWSVFSFERIGDAVVLKDDESELRVAVNVPGQTTMDLDFEQIEQEVLAKVDDLEVQRERRSIAPTRPGTTPSADGWVNKLILGDNLDVFRSPPDSDTYIPSESIDLVYLDPPFNSKATYNQLFKEHSGEVSAAQIKAFDDTWHWSLESERTFQEVVLAGGKLAELLQAFRSFLGQSDMMAYITMMAPRLAEMHRVLKPTGSIYLHCDPTASHYLKVLMDTIWEPEFFRNEIIWQRSTAKGHATKRFAASSDTILFYDKGPGATWNQQYLPHREELIKSHYNNIEPDTGRRFTLGDCTNPNRNRPNLTYEWNGIVKVWRWTKERMQQLDDDGRLHYTRTGMPRYKRYLDEMPGTPVTSVWTDIPPINSQAAERLGYPTQKPEKLLERIVEASSNPGDLVLDPFAGCGTATSVAERLGRRWIGIDISDLALTVMNKRLHDTFSDDELSPYEVVGDPTDPASARRLAQRDPFAFEWWAVRMLRAEPRYKKGSDRGIDGVINFFGESQKKADKIIIQVKGGRVGSRDVRDLRGVVDRENAAIGVLVTAQPPTRDMDQEAVSAGFFSVRGVATADYPKIQILTVDDLFEGYGIDYPRYGHIDGYGQAPRQRKARDRQERLAG